VLAWLVLFVLGIGLIVTGIIVYLRSPEGRKEETALSWHGFNLIFRAAGISVVVIGVLLAGFAAPHLVDAGPHASIPPTASPTDTSSPEVTASAAISPSGASSPTTPTPTPTFSPASSAVWLDELAVAQGSPSPFSTGLTQLGGRDIPHEVGILAWAGSPTEVDYDIGGHYSQLQVALAIGDQHQAPAHLDIVGDGRSLLSGGVDVSPNGQLTSEAVNVAGVRRLALIATTISNGPALAMFCNPKLVPVGPSVPLPPVPPASSPMWLDQLAPANGSPSPFSTGSFQVQGRGGSHGVGLLVWASSPTEVDYDIGGHYSQLQVALAIGDQHQAPAHLDIVGDGRSLLSGGVDVSPNGQLTSEAVNVAGVRRLALIATTISNGPALAMFCNSRLVP
jgi:hypothetical protein